MYKIGSRPDLRTKNSGEKIIKSEYKVVDDYSAVNGDEKPNLIFEKSESVLDDEGKTNPTAQWLSYIWRG